MRYKLITTFKKHEEFNGYTFNAENRNTAKAHIGYKLNLTKAQQVKYFNRMKLRLKVID